MEKTLEFMLSICIPTRNRAKYIGAVAEKLLASLPDYVEIVIADNSDDPNARLARLAELNGRVVYVHDEGEISFAGNFNRAVNYCRGRYITAIGDDDYVLPVIVDMVRMAEREGADAVVYGFDAVYYWAGVAGRSSEDSGLLRVFKCGRISICEVAQAEELSRFLEGGLEDYTKTRLARVYHGVVGRDLVERVRKAHGNLYGGLSPDIYSAILLSMHARKVLHVDVSLTIPGVSPNSGSGQSASGKHRGDLSAAPHFRGAMAYEWDESIPRFYSVQSIWAESAIKALSSAGPALISKVDYSRFLAHAMMRNMRISPLIVKAVLRLERGERARYSFPRAFFFMLVRAGYLVAGRMKGRRRDRVDLRADDIAEAAELLDGSQRRRLGALGHNGDGVRGRCP